MYEDEGYHRFLVQLRRAAWREGNPIEWFRLVLHPYRTPIFLIGVFLAMTIYEFPSGVFAMALALWVQDRRQIVSLWMAVVFFPIAIVWNVLLAAQLFAQ